MSDLTDTSREAVERLVSRIEPVYPNTRSVTVTGSTAKDIACALRALLARAEADVANRDAQIVALGKQSTERLRALFTAETRIRELEAALPRAWEMGRDDVANLRLTRIIGTVGFRDDTKAAIRTLTPPADLAERIKGASDDI